VRTQHFGPQLEVKFWWRPTGYNYPDPISRDFEARYAVYRWAIYPPGSTSTDPGEQYIGETADLTSRVKAYLRPTPRRGTDLRIKQILEDQLTQGSRIQLQLLEFEQFEIVTGKDSVLLSTFELFDQFKRKMMENFAILATPQNRKPLNLLVDRISSKIRKARETKKLLGSPEGRKQLYQDRDVKTVLEIMKRREETDPDAQTH
jgi:hypothetical protein